MEELRFVDPATRKVPPVVASGGIKTIGIFVIAIALLFLVVALATQLDMLVAFSITIADLMIGLIVFSWGKSVAVNEEIRDYLKKMNEKGE